MEAQTKTTKIEDLLESKVLAKLEAGEDVVKFIEEYIEDKTYKTFRTFAKRATKITEDLLEYGFIDKRGAERIKEAMTKKRTERKPKLIFKLDTFLEDYMLLFHSIKKAYTNPLNILFLALPFFRDMPLKDIINLKLDDLRIEKQDSFIRIFLINNEHIVPITIMRYSSEWFELYSLYKENSNIEYPLKLLGSTHTIFSNNYGKHLNRYSTTKSIEFKYFSAIKNSLKYSNTRFTA